MPCLRSNVHVQPTGNGFEGTVCQACWNTGGKTIASEFPVQENENPRYANES